MYFSRNGDGTERGESLPVSYRFCPEVRRVYTRVGASKHTGLPAAALETEEQQTQGQRV